MLLPHVIEVGVDTTAPFATHHPVYFDISIGGDVDHTNMDLSSPEFPDQTDVMSMLLFGKPTSAMSETEGESGAGLLSAAMASMRS